MTYTHGLLRTYNYTSAGIDIGVHKIVCIPVIHLYSQNSSDTLASLLTITKLRFVVYWVTIVSALNMTTCIYNYLYW